MNAYTKHSILKFYEKYENRTFDQDDVAFFIVVCRDYSTKNSIFRELGDYLAHPNLKDRGMTINNFKHAVEYFEKNTDSMLDGEGPNVPAPVGIGMLKDIQVSLLELFRMIEIERLEDNIHNLSFRDFVYCLIFLLGSFKIRLNGKVCALRVYFSSSLSLKVSYPSDKYDRFSIELQLIFLGNVYSGLNYHREEVENHIVRRFVGGSLGAIPYEYDKAEYLTGERILPKGIGYPMQDYYW